MVQYVPPARLLTMAEIEATNLEAANIAALEALPRLVAEQELTPPPLVRSINNAAFNAAFDFDTDTDTEMSDEEYKIWFERNFGYPFDLPLHPFLPPQL